MDSSSSSSSPVVNLDIDILDTINESRQMHGLRHQDYARYRQYASRKVHRLRVTCQNQQGHKRKFEKKPLQPSDIQSISHIHLLLFSVERYWAYAMELKLESSTAAAAANDAESNNTHNPARKHQHAMKKLRRAAQAASHFESVLSAVSGSGSTTSNSSDEQKTAVQLSQKLLLDVKAYAAMMNGYLLFEQMKWKDALDQFATARTIYETALKSSNLSSHQEILYQNAIDTIDPNIRYCAYNLKLKDGGNKTSAAAAAAAESDVEAIMEMIRKQGGNNELDMLSEKLENVLDAARIAKASVSQQTPVINWRGQSLPIRNQKLWATLLKAKDLETELKTLLSSNNITTTTPSYKDQVLALFESISGCYWDSQKVSEKDIREDEIATSKIKSSKSTANTHLLTTIHSYIVYCRISQTISRNHFMINRLTPFKTPLKSSLEESIKLTNGIVTAIQQILDMPVLQQPDSTSTQNSQSLQLLMTLLSHKMEYFNLFKKLLLTQYVFSVNKSPESALNLLIKSVMTGSESLSRDVQDLSTKIASHNKSNIDTQDMGLLEEIRTSLQTLWKESNVLRVCLLGELAKSQTNQHHTPQEPNVFNPSTDALIENLDQFFTAPSTVSPVLVKYPPPLSPTPAKPLVFDIALNALLTDPYDSEVSNGFGTVLKERLKRRAEGHAYQRDIDVEEIVKRKESEQQQQASTGGRLGGWLGGWLGGSGGN